MSISALPLVVSSASAGNRRASAGNRRLRAGGWSWRARVVRRSARAGCPFARVAAGRRRGFTMLETLLVLMLGGMLLMAAASFLFGVVRLREDIESEPQLKQHAGSVIRLLEGVFAAAEPVSATDSQGGVSGSGDAANAGGGGSGGSGGGSQGTGAGTAAGAGTASGASATSAATLVSWKDLPPSIFGNNKALFFKARGGLPVFVRDTGPVPTSVECYLQFDESDGLVLLWQSERMKREDSNDWERTVLSPLIVSASLLFYDSARSVWEQSSGLEPLRTDDSALPQVLSLVFANPGGGRQIHVEVLLPVASMQLLGL